VERGDSRAALLRHVARRSAIIFALGLLLNAFPHFDPATLRIPGVLQRIAVCYLAGSAVFLFTGLRGQVAALVLLLAGYWALMTLVPVPGYGPGVLEKHGNLAQYLDSLALSGHMWAQTKTWDPEGILSTLPAIGTVMLGILAGRLLRVQRLGALVVLGLALVAAGLIADRWFPINKNLWTTSFTLFMAGLSTLAFAAFYWLIDIQGRHAWARPFVIFGRNAIAIYVLSGILGDALGVTGLWTWVFAHVYAPLANPYNASLLFALTFVLVLYFIAYGMYRRRWFVKI